MRVVLLSLLAFSACALELRSPICNVSATMAWDPEQRIQIDLADARGEQAARIELSEDKVKVLAMGYREKHLTDLKLPHSTPGELPEAMGELDLLVKLRHDRWVVFAGHTLMLRMPALFPAANITFTPEPMPDSLHAQKIAPMRFDDDFIRAEDDAPLAKWTPEYGKWSLRTVHQDALDQKSMDKPDEQTVEASHSPNFFSLAGESIEDLGNTIISTGLEFADDYELRASMQTQPGEMGLVFYKQERSYYSFTLHMPRNDADPCILLLRRRGFGRIPNVETLAAASVDLTREQWVSLKVRAADGRIRCAIDNTTIFDIAESLPTGGRFGLLARGNRPIRFDDVHMASVSELPLNSLADIAFHAVAGEPDLYRRVVKASTTQGDLILPSAPQHPWLAIGGKTARPAQFAASFEPRGPSFDAGIICGYHADNRAHYRFRTSRNEAVLERVLGSIIREVDRFAAPTDAVTYRLKIVREDGKLRCYRNDRLVFLYDLPKPLVGACGVWSDGRTQLRVRDLDYRHVAPPALRDQREKNTVFQADPYMRHWSSPEGNWYTDAEERIWHKSDFFGRFRLHLPMIDEAEVHLGVREGKDTGSYVLRCLEDRLALFDASEKELTAIPREDGDEEWDIHADGHYLSLQIDKRERHYRIPTPLRGTRIRIDGFRTRDLADSWVDRWQVKDYLFTEAPHEWIINGGKWQVINRFQCDPRFSHLNGENAKDRAAMWTKYDFSGDFCVELYAGIRHGWYERCGDINMTMINRDHSPSRGYTVTCTEWDPDLSQEWSTFFREGVALARSRAYTIPRFRHDNERKVTDPLIKEGRDVHGAWYYLKLRRIGNQLSYSFDNEEIFTIIDDKQLQNGPFGLWTFLNSLVVARVKIAAETIAPRQIPFRPVSPDRMESLLTPEISFPAPSYGDAFSAFAAGLRAWQADDAVSQPVMRWQESRTEPLAFSMTNRLGGGAFFAKSAHPRLRSSQLLGFRFDLRRDVDARFNFHYQVMRGDTLVERSFVQLCGSDYDRGDYRLRGMADVPAGADFTTVHAWLPAQFLDEDLEIDVDGFGNRQPGRELAGLGGNGIGVRYSVRGFTPILTAPPTLSEESLGLKPRTVLLLDEASNALIHRGADLAAATEALAGHSTDGLNAVVCRAIDVDHKVHTFPIVWLKQPDQPELELSWSDKPRSLLLRTPQPDPRVTKMDFFIGKEAIRRRQVDELSWELPLRRDSQLGDPLRIRYQGKETSIEIPWQGGRPDDVPVLTELEGLPFVENFEREARRFRIKASHHAEVVDGAYRVFNTDLKQRLRATATMRDSWARYPVLSFRYRAEPLARISMGPPSGRYARLAEDFGTPIRGGGLALDNSWQRWEGRISDTMADGPFNGRRFSPAHLYLGSMHQFDQTGRHSRLELDDMVFGPALSADRELRITPTYDDLDGIYAVYHALAVGDADRGRLTWNRSENGEPIAPDLAGLPEGPATLLLRATDTRNKLSQLTEIPLLIDRQPPAISHKFVDSESPDGNGRELYVRFEIGEGAPLDVDALEFAIGDEPLELSEDVPPRILVEHRPDADALVIDWPYLFRKQLDNTDSAVLRLGLSNIVDGAGNRLPDQHIDIPVDRESDKIGPTWLPMDVSRAVRWRPGWYHPGAGRDVGGGGNAKIALVRNFGEEPFLRLSASGSKSAVRRDVKEWVIGDHPYVSFWVRLPELPEGDEHEILVSADGEEDGEVAIWPGDEFVNWEADTWHPVTLDMRKHGARGVATWLDIRRTRLKARADMDIAGLLVHRKWRADDALHLAGYDASGLKHVEWEFIDAAGNVDRQGRAPIEALKPHALGLTGGIGKWLFVYLVDKAANRSLPLRVPVP